MSRLNCAFHKLTSNAAEQPSHLCRLSIRSAAPPVPVHHLSDPSSRACRTIFTLTPAGILLIDARGRNPEEPSGRVPLRYSTGDPRPQTFGFRSIFFVISSLDIDFGGLKTLTKDQRMGNSPGLAPRFNSIRMRLPIVPLIPNWSDFVSNDRVDTLFECRIAFFQHSVVDYAVRLNFLILGGESSQIWNQ